MIASMKEICIFMIIAQAVLFFVPGNTYVKYVRVLVGIMMILQITRPLIRLFTDEEKRQEISLRMAELERALGQDGPELTVPDAEEEIRKGIEEELKKRLEGCGGDFRVLDVALKEEGEEIQITLEEEKRRENQENGSGMIRIDPVRAGREDTDQGNTGDEKEKELGKLQELYGSALGVEGERIRIVFH